MVDQLESGRRALQSRVLLIRPCHALLGNPLHQVRTASKAVSAFIRIAPTNAPL
jgi:hypothetical protein